MKKIATLILIGLCVIGCKKYQNDPFLSTYSPEARLTKGDSCVWTCVKYSLHNGVVMNVPAYHYSLSLTNDYRGTIGFADLGPSFEISNSKDWSLANDKETFKFFSDFQINKLTMNQLELKDTYNNVYFFEKRKKRAISSLDNEILNVPMFGLFDETVKLTGFNSCENQGGDVEAWNSSTGQDLGKIKGFLGNGLGFDSDWDYGPKFNNFSITKNFENSGYITFWVELYGSKIPPIKLNGQEITNYTIISESSPYMQISVKVSSGNQNIFITTYVGSGNFWYDRRALTVIDEVRYWEIVN